MALLAQGVEARVDDAEMLFSAGDGAQAARDFLFHLRHAYGTFAQVVRQRDRKVTDEEQHGVGMLPEAPQQIECNGLFGAPTLVVRRVRFRIAPALSSGALRKCSAMRSAVPCKATFASPTRETSVPGETQRPYTSRISSAARA